MTAVIYQGAVAPEAFFVDVVPGKSGVDLTTVSAASMTVKMPDGTTASWPCAIVATPPNNQVTPNAMRVVHVLSGPDTAQLGSHGVVVMLSVPGGTLRSEPGTFSVAPQFP